jgi:uncharacterized membrane protein HdeD (DUF308 family)
VADFARATSSKRDWEDERGDERDAGVRAAGPWWLLLIAGVLSVAVGIIILAKPAIGLATLAVVAGIFMLLDGIFEIFVSLLVAAENRTLRVILGVVSALVGVVLIRHPIHGVVAIALLLGLWLMTSGVVRLVSAFGQEGHRVWRIFVALIDLGAGIIIVSTPGIGVATLALFAGLAFILRGLVTCAVGWILRSAPDEIGPPPPAAITTT